MESLSRFCYRVIEWWEQAWVKVFWIIAALVMIGSYTWAGILYFSK